MEFTDGWVHYEAFGAKGDGVANDMPAICEAHDYANTHGLGVRTKPDATYYIGDRDMTAVITTETDWNTSRFTINDVDIEHHKVSLFEVRSTLQPEELKIDQLTRDQKQVDARPERDCYVMVEKDSKKLYIRRGLNQNKGTPQHDCFILRKDGTIESPIDWEYDEITRIEAHPIDETRLVIRGGIFTTFANRMKQEVGYNYWARNIEVHRSNTEIDGVTHYVVGETSVGHPYRGFISVQKCANITLRNCFATGHKIYSTIGAAGKPVNMGSYDLHANNVVNFHMLNCRMNHITDRTHWGVIASNFCKNILLEDCTLSRMDTHMGVSGTYVIRRCELGHMGLNAIGRGDLILEDSTLHGNSLISFRGDYGSTWEGNVHIRNCRWIPACGNTTWPHMIGASNDGMHDFGYPCSMPTEVIVEGLFVDDTNHPEDYQGMYLFTDPDGIRNNVDGITPTEERPFPYKICEKVTLQDLTTASGKKPQISPNEKVNATTVVTEKPSA